MVVLSKNINDIEDILKLCEKYDISKLYLFTLKPNGRGEKIYDKEYVSPEKIDNHISKFILKYKCLTKIIDWKIEGQCVLLYTNGDLFAQPSYQDKDNQRFVGNILKEDPKEVWEKYPFRDNHINYYKYYH